VIVSFKLAKKGGKLAKVIVIIVNGCYPRPRGDGRWFIAWLAEWHPFFCCMEKVQKKIWIYTHMSVRQCLQH